MSTPQEKLEAIQHAVEVAKKRLVRLDALKSVNALTKAQDYEREMTIDCIQRGEKILKEKAVW